MATHPLPASFCKNLGASGLLAPQQIATALHDLAEIGVHSESEVASSLVRHGLLTQYQVDRLLEGRTRGFFFDQYKLVDFLGVGGMGCVYQATDTADGKTVALKVLLEQFKHDRGMLSRFQQEARSTLAMNHPNIARTFNVGNAGGHHYRVMEFIKGPSLLEILLRTKRLPWKQACEFTRQAAVGLHYSHQSGLIHRDIKPQNLLIDGSGCVKILDFGLSMIQGGEQDDEFSIAMIFGHECVGTAAFMAPEQSEDSLTVDARSDVYSLGCTLFAMLTGHTPFPERSVAEIRKAHRTQTPRSVRELAASIPEEVAQIVMKMLAKNRDDRFASAAEVATTLAKWSRPAKLNFNFSEILAERQKHVQQRMSESLKIRPRTKADINSLAPATEFRSLTDETNMGREAGRQHKPGVKTPESANSPSGPENLGGIALATGSTMLHERPTHAKSRASLTPLNGDHKVPLFGDQILIGRDAECDIELADASVSGRHCQINCLDTEWWITDWGSRNGTRVNGIVVRQRLLHHGDEITIGGHLRFRLDCESGHSASQRLRFRKRILLSLGAVAFLIIAMVCSASWRRYL